MFHTASLSQCLAVEVIGEVFCVEVKEHSFPRCTYGSCWYMNTEDSNQLEYSRSVIRPGFDYAYSGSCHCLDKLMM